ncbi:MAG: hypothetical protein IJ194_03115 [Bacilli bacterium]|nr:hypothetical protein [Bacilli bacterium]
MQFDNINLHPEGIKSQWFCYQKGIKSQSLLHKKGIKSQWFCYQKGIKSQFVFMDIKQIQVKKQRKKVTQEQSGIVLM